MLAIGQSPRSLVQKNNSVSTSKGNDAKYAGKLSGDLVHLKVYSPSKRPLDKTRSNFSNGQTLEGLNNTPNATACRDETANINDDELLNQLTMGEGGPATPIKVQ